MFLIKQFRQISPIYLAIPVLFVSGLYYVCLSFTYEDCSGMDGFSIPNNCASPTEKLLFPAGLMLLMFAGLFPVIVKYVERGHRLKLPKITE